MDIQQPCPVCKHPLDAHTDIFDKDDRYKPQPGDYSICFNCGSTLQFRRDRMVWIPPSEESKLPFEHRDAIAKVRVVWEKFKREYT